MQLECTDMTFRYPGTETTVFEDLSFQMAGPGFNALFGPSGVGKTSIARILTGDLEDFSGQLQTRNIDRILYSYNIERLPGWSAVGKHLERITTPEQQTKREQLVDLFGMTPYLGSRFSQLSLGQKNRVNLIRYLLQDFQMLIMDESLANVDELTEVAKFCREILVLTGPGKNRSAVVVKGQDQQAGQSLEQRHLETTMLEIMNAA